MPPLVFRSTPSSACSSAEWIKQYRDARPGLEVLQAQVDQWMAEYDAREEQVRKYPCSQNLRPVI
jgi:hypothetical protein